MFVLGKANVKHVSLLHLIVELGLHLKILFYPLFELIPLPLATFAHLLPVFVGVYDTFHFGIIQFLSSLHSESLLVIVNDLEDLAVHLDEVGTRVAYLGLNPGPIQDRVFFLGAYFVSILGLHLVSELENTFYPPVLVIRGIEALWPLALSQRTRRH